jgi:hypothetical protein
VIRDGGGKFAKKGASVAQSVVDTTAILKQGFDLTGDTIQSLIKDPEFRKRTGIATGLPMAKLISNLATQARLNPKLTEKLDEWIANATKEFADQYGDDKNPMAQAIRNNKLAQPPKDASFNEKMEFRVAQYTAYQEALKNPEDFSKRDEIIGKAAAAAIPIGVSLAIALGFEVAIPLFLAQSVNWATVLSSVALGEAADFAVQKGMDKLEINNPALRIGASMVAGILAGGLVTGVNNKIKNIERLEVERLANEEAKRLADEEAERLTKERVEKLAKEKIEHESKKEYERLIKEESDRIEKEYEELFKKKVPTPKSTQELLEDKAERLAKLQKPSLSVQKVLNDMGLDFPEILKAIHNINHSQDARNTLLVDIEKTLENIHQLQKDIESLDISADIHNIQKERYRELMKNKEKLLEKKAQLRIAEGKGYSPEKRLLEASEIMEKEGIDSPRYLWRKAVLQAEVKYGKYLDEIQNGVENGYAKLMKSLKKDHNYNAECIFVENDPGTQNIMALELSIDVKNSINDIVSDFQDIVSIPLKIHIGSRDLGIYAIQGKRATSNITNHYFDNINILKDFPFLEEESNGFVHVGGVFRRNPNEVYYSSGYNVLCDPDTQIKESLWHEMGHLVEASILKSQKTAQSFLKDRESESWLIGDIDELEESTFFSGNIIKAIDHFFDGYMGTQYMDNGSNTVLLTELISSGFEGLSSPWMAKSMTIRDRESLLYAIAVSEMK